MRLNRLDQDVAWRALARSCGVTDEVARRLWARAESEAASDPAKAERAFRRMLTETLDTLAVELEAAGSSLSDPGKWTRVLVEERKLPGSTAEPTSHPEPPPAMSPATRLRHALEAAVHAGESAARTMAASDATTITEALRRLRDGQAGAALAAVDGGALAQLVRLGDALVSLVEHGRDDARAGKPLPAGLRGDLESRLGGDFGDVRVHDDPVAAAEASRHDAIAFARGTDVFFADGMYDPSSTAGKQLIAHEVAHVAQQRGGPGAASGAISEPGSAVEREADRVAGAFAAGLAPGAAAFAVHERAAAGTVSRKAAGTADPAAAAPAGPKDWKTTLLGQTLDLSSRLAGARDIGEGKKQIDVNQSVGPLRIQHATFKASGDKVESGTLVASVDAGSFKGSTGTLTVDSSGRVSGTLTVPVNVPGLLVKQISVEVGGGSITGKARLSPGDFNSPDFSIKASDFDLTVSSKGSGVEVGLTGSATVTIDNGMAQGQAKMDVDLHAGADGVSFNATVTGKIAIAGLADADAVIRYDGKTVKIEAGATVPVHLPGLEGTANIKYEKGKLSLDSKDLHFTIPQLKPVNFEQVQVSQSKLGAKLSLGSPINVPLPGGASLTLEQSSIVIDGTAVSGDVTGTFALNNAGGLTGKVELAYQRGGDITGNVTIAGGAKFTVGGVDVTIDNGSTLAVGKTMGVTGDVAGTVKIPGVPSIAVHVVARQGEPIDLTCDTNIPLNSIVPQLGGDVHVQYHRGGGANAFAFDASNVSVSASPINGQVIFTKLSAHLQGRELTGSLTAASGTVIKAGSTSVTIVGGTIHLLPGKILDGDLKARSQAGETAVEATVGWKQGKFDWSAEGDFDLGPMTSNALIGSVHAAAGSSGTGEFVSNGKITFGSPALRDVEISHLSGNKEQKHFTATVNAQRAVDKILEKVPNVDVHAGTAQATITYQGGGGQGGGLKLDAKIEGTAKYPRDGSKLEGNFHLGFDEATGFTGKIDGVKLKASEYFNSKDGTADLQTGKVNLGEATFEVPSVCKGKVTTANVNVKTGEFKVEADVDATAPALKDLKLRVALDNNTLTASLRENAPPIHLGQFATLTVGGGSKINLAKGTGLTAHLAGTVEATGLGTGEFQLDYGADHKVTGKAHVDVKPFAMFEGLTLDMKLDENRKVSTEKPIDLALAPEYEAQFAADAKVSVTDNQFKVEGHVKEVKNLGSVSEAFSKHGGATITWNQRARQVTVNETFAVDAVMPELAPGSDLQLTYSGGRIVTITGTLKPKNKGPIAFTPDSHITADWTSVTKRLVVSGEAHAEIQELCKADFTVDAGLGGTLPGTFGLKGHIDPSKLAEKFPGISFSSVSADFSVLIGKGLHTDLNFHLNAQVSGIPAAGVTDISAHIDADYRNGEGISGELAVTRAKLGDVIADGRIQVEHNRFKSGSLHLLADFPSLKVEGTGTVTAGDMGGLTTTAELKVTPGGTSPLARFIQSGNIHVDIAKWKLTNAVGQLHLVPPSFLPIENPTIEVGYQPGVGLHAELSTQFNAPMAKHGEKGTFKAGYKQGQGLYAHIEFPITVPGFQAATVAGDLDQKGIHVGAVLTPKDAAIVKQASVQIGYDFGGGFYVEGSITLKPSEQLELVVGLRYEQGKGLQVLGITPNDKATTTEDHEIAHWKKQFPTIPLATVGVASLGLQFGMGVAAGYRMPRIKFKNPQLEGGLEALDHGGMPAFTFGGQIAMGAYISLSLSVQVVGEIQLLIASCDAGIGAEIAARLNLELGADVDGRFAPGQGALLQIDPFVGASLDLIASLIATLHAEICWFTIVDKKWTLASANFAHIELGQFHPFNPVGLQIGGPGGTRLTNGLTLRDDAFDQIKEGVKEGAKHAGDDEANQDARDHVAPVLRSFKNAARQFEELPPGWENGMTAAPVDFHSMFPVKKEEWDYYQDHADTAEQVDPADACVTPTQKLAKAVGVTAHKDPAGAGRLILAWRRAQIAHKGVNPDTGVNVVEEREIVQALIEAKYQADLAAAIQKQKEQDQEHADHVKRQESDYRKAESTHEQTAQQQKVAHDQTVVKTQTQWTEAQQKKVTAAKHAQQEGAQVAPAKEEKAPPPPKPAAPPAPRPLAKPAPIPVPPKVPMPPPPEVLPAVTLPALPADPGVSVHAAAAIPPAQKKVQPQSPGAKSPPAGGSPDPMPGTPSNAKQAGGGGGQPMPGGKTGGGGGKAGGGGSTSAAPRPGPAVAAGPDGIISQQRTLDAKKLQFGGGSAPAGAGGKPGLLGKLGSPGLPTAAGAPAQAGKPGAPAAPGAAPAAGAKPAAASGGLDPTVQKVVDQGKADEAAYKQKLAQQSQTYSTKVTQEDKTTAAETKKLEEEAAAAKKRKEQEKAAAAGGPAAAPGAAPLGPDGKPVKKPTGPIGARVPLNILGETHTQYIESTGAPMVASQPTPVSAKLSEVGGAINAAPADVKKQASAPAQTAQGQAQQLASLATKAAAGDESANTAVAGAQQALAGPLKITWSWATVAKDPAVVGGSIEDPLKHPYYPTFKGRVATLSSLGHISGVDPAPFAESTWRKICKAVKAAHPVMTDPAAYSDFAKGWLNMKSPEFQKAIAEFDHLGKEIAKAGSAGFAKARNFGFWSKDEGRSLAEAISDLTLETSAIGGLMDGLPTLDGKQAGWDPEVWGALSNAYATAVVPELLKGKKINVCVGAGVPAGNIWEAVESEAITKGLKGTKLTLDKVSTHYAAAAKSKTDRKALDLAKQASGIKGCVFAGDRAGAIAAANAHFASLDSAPKDGKTDPNKPDGDKAHLEEKLDSAVKAVEAVMEDNPTLEGAQGQIDGIRAKFELKRLDVKLTSPDEVTIDAEINPKRQAKEKFKKSQIARIRDPRQRQRACEQAGFHGKEIERRGGSPQRAEAKNATALKRHQEQFDKLNAIKTGLEADVAALEGVLATLQQAPPAPGAKSKAQIEEQLAAARVDLEKCKARIGGVSNSIAGITHEDRAATQLKPDQRNVEVVCALCKGVVTDLDLVKREGGQTTAFEAKASSSAVNAEQIRKQIEAVKQLYGDASKVMLALPKLTARDRQILEEKFSRAQMPVPDIAEIEQE